MGEKVTIQNQTIYALMVCYIFGIALYSITKLPDKSWESQIITTEGCM